MWSWWGLCPAPCRLGLVLSSASTKQAYFVLRFPNISVGFPTALYRYFARHCCWHRNFQLSPSGLHCELEFFVVWFDEEHSSQMSGIVELWFLDSPSLFPLLFRCISHTLPHIWPYIVWTRGCLFPCKSRPTMYIRQVAFRSIKWILWNLSMHLTILFSPSTFQ